MAMAGGPDMGWSGTLRTFSPWMQTQWSRPLRESRYWSFVIKAMVHPSVIKIRNQGVARPSFVRSPRFIRQPGTRPMDSNTAAVKEATPFSLCGL
jgi:hypothetical protein